MVSNPPSAGPSDNPTNEIIMFQSDFDHPTNLRTLFSESWNHAVLDSGASKTICESMWLSTYVDSLSDSGISLQLHTVTVTTVFALVMVDRYSPPPWPGFPHILVVRESSLSLMLLILTFCFCFPKFQWKMPKWTLTLNRILFKH